MKKTLALLLTACGAINAYAEIAGLGVSVRAIAGTVSNELTIDTKSTNSAPMLGLGLTLVGERFSLDLMHVDGNSGGRQWDGDYVFQNWVDSASLSYSINEKLSVFAGYQATNTFNNPINTSVKPPSFRPHGVTIGGTYGWWVGKESSLSVSAGYSFMNASLSCAGPACSTVETKGSGLSINAKFSGPISDTWRYGVEWKNVTFSYDSVNVTGWKAIAPKESSNYLFLSVSKSW